MKADGDTPGIDQAAPRPLSRAYRRISRVLPELGRFKSDEERKTALERADAEVLKSSGFRRGMVVATVAFAALIVVVFVLLLWFPFLLGTALSTVSLGALFGVIVARQSVGRCAGSWPSRACQSACDARTICAARSSRAVRNVGLRLTRSCSRANRSTATHDRLERQVWW